jgi:hypothetical protein
MTFGRFAVIFIAPLALATAAILTSVPAALSEALAKPTGDVVLTVAGQIGKENASGQADFDLEMLEAMPAVKFRTSTPWTEEAVEFEGVLIDTIMKAVDAKGKTIKAAALNDYIADVGVDLVVSAGAILAYRINGAEIAVRDKGPLWIMFPFDQNPELKTETIYSQSVWQLRTMTFVD